jgi:hypothetical protein
MFREEKRREEKRRLRQNLREEADIIICVSALMVDEVSYVDSAENKDDTMSIQKILR